MEALLRRIRELYVRDIPKALETLDVLTPVYGAFIPYGGWEMFSTDDEAMHSRTLYLVDEAYRNSLIGKTSDPNEVSRCAYGWPEFIGGPSIKMESQELHALLVEWYDYLYSQSDEKENARRLLNAIGSAIATAIATACLHLNSIGWQYPFVTPDFVVFTDCVADYWYDVGIRESVPTEWWEQKRSCGMFTYLDKTVS